MHDTLKGVIVPVHREGRPFIAIFLVTTLLLWWLWTPLVVLGLVLTCWCIYFFRDPERVTPTRKGLVISPADGVVQMIEEAVPPSELNMGETPLTRVSVFMNVFNVHVNRIPTDGKITRLAYRPGKFVNASQYEAKVSTWDRSIDTVIIRCDASKRGKRGFSSHPKSLSFFFRG